MQDHLSTPAPTRIGHDEFCPEDSRQQKNLSRTRGADPMLPPGTNRCLCVCGEYFAGVRAFELHRVTVRAEAGVTRDRACLGLAGMSQIGLRIDSQGYWGRKWPGDSKTGKRSRHLKLVAP